MRAYGRSKWFMLVGSRLFACLPVLLVDGALTSRPALATSSKLPLAPSTGSSELSALLTTIEGAHLPLLAAISLVVLVK